MWVFEALVNAHNRRVHALHKSNDLTEVLHRRRTEEMHDSQIAPASHVSNEGLALLFGGFGIRPQPILNIHTPIDDLGFLNIFCESLTGSRTECAEGRTEIAACQQSAKLYNDGNQDLHTLNPKDLSKRLDIVHNFPVNGFYRIQPFQSVITYRQFLIVAR